ncbi:hypothetical protein AAVH_26794 [Aphelenchoides avenae]|nr:hypothetical protein AAVH_26794 [Aphelenchus avenae]
MVRRPVENGADEDDGDELNRSYHERLAHTSFANAPRRKLPKMVYAVSDDDSDAPSTSRNGGSHSPPDQNGTPNCVSMDTSMVTIRRPNRGRSSRRADEEPRTPVKQRKQHVIESDSDEEGHANGHQNGVSSSMVTVRRPGRAKSNKRAESHQRSNRGSPTKSSRKEAVILEEDSSEWSEEEPSMVARCDPEANKNIARILKEFTSKKINVQNAFESKVLDELPGVVQVEPLQSVGAVLDASARIYAFRVDNTHHSCFAVRSNIESTLSADAAPKKRNKAAVVEEVEGGEKETTRKGRNAGDDAAGNESDSDEEGGGPRRNVAQSSHQKKLDEEIAQTASHLFDIACPRTWDLDAESLEKSLEGYRSTMEAKVVEKRQTLTAMLSKSETQPLPELYEFEDSIYNKITKKYEEGSAQSFISNDIPTTSDGKFWMLHTKWDDYDRERELEHQAKSPPPDELLQEQYDVDVYLRRVQGTLKHAVEPNPRPSDLLRELCEPESDEDEQEYPADSDAELSDSELTEEQRLRRTEKEAKEMEEMHRLVEEGSQEPARRAERAPSQLSQDTNETITDDDLADEDLNGVTAVDEEELEEESTRFERMLLTKTATKPEEADLQVTVPAEVKNQLVAKQPLSSDMIHVLLSSADDGRKLELLVDVRRLERSLAVSDLMCVDELRDLQSDEPSLPADVRAAARDFRVNIQLGDQPTMYVSIFIMHFDAMWFSALTEITDADIRALGLPVPKSIAPVVHVKEEPGDDATATTSNQTIIPRGHRMAPVTPTKQGKLSPTKGWMSTPGRKHGVKGGAVQKKSPKKLFSPGRGKTPQKPPSSSMSLNSDVIDDGQSHYFWARAEKPPKLYAGQDEDEDFGDEDTTSQLLRMEDDEELELEMSDDARKRLEQRVEKRRRTTLLRLPEIQEEPASTSADKENLEPTGEKTTEGDAPSRNVNDLTPNGDMFDADFGGGDFEPPASPARETTPSTTIEVTTAGSASTVATSEVPPSSPGSVAADNASDYRSVRDSIETNETFATAHGGASTSASFVKGDVSGGTLGGDESTMVVEDTPENSALGEEDFGDIVEMDLDDDDFGPAAAVPAVNEDAEAPAPMDAAAAEEAPAEAAAQPIAQFHADMDLLGLEEEAPEDEEPPPQNGVVDFGDGPQAPPEDQSHWKGATQADTQQSDESAKGKRKPRKKKEKNVDEEEDVPDNFFVTDGDAPRVPKEMRWIMTDNVEALQLPELRRRLEAVLDEAQILADPTTLFMPAPQVPKRRTAPQKKAGNRRHDCACMMEEFSRSKLFFKGRVRNPASTELDEEPSDASDAMLDGPSNPASVLGDLSDYNDFALDLDHAMEADGEFVGENPELPTEDDLDAIIEINGRRILARQTRIKAPMVKRAIAAVLSNEQMDMKALLKKRAEEESLIAQRRAAEEPTLTIPDELEIPPMAKSPRTSDAARLSVSSEADRTLCADEADATATDPKTPSPLKRGNRKRKRTPATDQSQGPVDETLLRRKEDQPTFMQQRQQEADYESSSDEEDDVQLEVVDGHPVHKDSNVAVENFPINGDQRFQNVLAFMPPFLKGRTKRDLTAVNAFSVMLHMCNENNLILVQDRDERRLVTEPAMANFKVQLGEPRRVLVGDDDDAN